MSATTTRNGNGRVARWTGIGISALAVIVVIAGALISVYAATVDNCRRIDSLERQASERYQTLREDMRALGAKLDRLLEHR